MKKIIVLFVCLCTVVATVSAQQTYNMGSTPLITSCNATIYDDGGSGSMYSAGVDQWMTIRPSNGAISILFVDMDIAETDTLFIYNGEITNPADDSIPLSIGSLAVNWVNNSNIIQLGEQRTSATIQNPTGVLTLRFKTAAGSVRGAGFELSISCEEPCQRIQPILDFANTVPTPHFDMDENDGYYYMDFCPGDTLHFAVNVNYPDNDYSYHQDISTTYFTWSMDPTQSGFGRNTADYVFNPGQGYDLTLTLHDVHNGNTCHAQTPIAIRIRGSRNPITGVDLLDDVCSGTDIPLRIGYDSTANISVETVSSTQESSLAVDSTVFIPDGPYCETQLGTACYNSSVNFTAFPPGATITSANDILAVRLNIEHSWNGDINISLVCPNGNEVLLKEDHNTNSGAYFGIMYEPDNGCYPQNNPQGTGWNYCWSENTNYANIATGYCYNHVTNNRIDSSNTVLKTNYYRPHDSFSRLVNCPLNGLWHIRVCDTWGSDNGYVFSWELSLDPALMPQDWTYDVDIESINWSGGNIEQTSDSIATIIADAPGDYTYTFTLVDEFGCEYSRDIPLTVVQTPVPDLGNNVNICIGDTAVLSSGFDYIGPNGQIEYSWTNLANNNEIGTVESITMADSATVALEITTTNADNTLRCSASDTVSVILNPQPIVGFEGDPVESCAPLNVTMTDMTVFTDSTNHPEVTLFYEWSVFDTLNQVVSSSSDAHPTLSIQEAGVYGVQLIVTTDKGCADTLVKTDYLRVYAQPIADFISNPERTNVGGDIDFLNITDTTVFSPDDVVHWTWNYGDNSDETNARNGLHAYSEWGEFIVTLFVHTEQGCADTITHTVYVEQELDFPNVITPNGDGINDVFAIKNMNPKLPNRLSIYNRWGKKVYEKENYQAYIKDDQLYNASEGFDGASLSDGVFYYTFHYEGYTKSVDYHGSLTILR